ncbi:MAG TPA: hypothetical protein VHF25_15225 [Nitriliruptorales bacterium]|nr:hypothetical protein [Nitriliruptorales bacterium]
MDAGPGGMARGGRRRMDRVLDPSYLEGLTTRPTEQIRRMRDECEEEESGVSYARRVLQGKLDILRAEALRRREEGEDGGEADLRSLLDALPSILADDVAARPLRTRVTRFLVPPTVQHHRREVERLASSATLSGVRKRSPEELAELVRQLTERERELSALRRQLLDRVDALQDELARRYRQGTADVSEVLSPRA